MSTTLANLFESSSLIGRSQTWNNLEWFCSKSCLLIVHNLDKLGRMQITHWLGYTEHWLHSTSAKGPFILFYCCLRNQFCWWALIIGKSIMLVVDMMIMTEIEVLSWGARTFLDTTTYFHFQRDVVINVHPPLICISRGVQDKLLWVSGQEGYLL